MDLLIPLKKIALPIVMTVPLAFFALMPMTLAVVPAPDGGYPGGNTAEGFNALFHLSPQDGGFNTAIGFYALDALETEGGGK